MYKFIGNIKNILRSRISRIILDKQQFGGMFHYTLPSLVMCFRKMYFIFLIILGQFELVQ